MSDELKDFTVTPTLTFEPLQEQAPVAEVKKEEPAKPEMDDSILSEEERKIVDDLHVRLTFEIQRQFCSTEQEHRRKWLIFQRMLLRRCAPKI